MGASETDGGIARRPPSLRDLELVPEQREQLIQLWIVGRRSTALIFTVVGVALGVAWGWSNGFIIALFGVIASLDSHRMVKRGDFRSPPVASVVLDVTLIMAGMALSWAPDSALGLPYAYIMLASMVMLPLRAAVPALLYGGVWYALTARDVVRLGEALPDDREVLIGILAGTAFSIFFFLMAAFLVRSINIHLTARDNQHDVLDRRARYQGALTGCASILLGSLSEQAVDEALAVLLKATEADYVFVDRNYIDPELGLCARLIHEASDDEDETEVPDSWMDGPYSELPTSYPELSQGRPVALLTSELEGREREIYEHDGIKSELCLPINVAGEWRGSIGFADYSTERQWSDDEVETLKAASEMIAAFWERMEAREQLQALVRAKDDFLAAVSHEIRTPLTTVVGLAHELADNPDTIGAGEREQLMELLAQQSDEVSDIVNDLLVAARAEAGSLVITNEVVDLRSVAEYVIQTSARQTSDTAEIEGDNVRAWADESRVRQILRNLVVNAERYGGHRIRLQLFNRDGLAGVAVRDDGSGVPDDRIGHVFEPYQSAHDPGSQPASVGLGLSVARQLARLMGGDVVYRRVGDWSVFEATFTAAAIVPADVAAGGAETTAG